MTRSECPRPETLQAYAVGKVDDSVFARASCHFETCGSCQEELAKLDSAHDPLVACLRGSYADQKLLDDFDRQLGDLPIGIPSSLPNEATKSSHLAAPALAQASASGTAVTGIWSPRGRSTQGVRRKSQAVYRWIDRRKARSTIAWKKGYSISALLHTSTVLALAFWIRPIIIPSRTFVVAYNSPDNDVSTTITPDLNSTPADGSPNTTWGNFPIYTESERRESIFSNSVPDLDSMEFAPVVEHKQMFSRLEDPDQLGRVVPLGATGRPRETVNDYQDALNRLTRELLSLLVNDNLLVVWCMDESESMKDDHRAISEVSEAVYSELESTVSALSQHRIVTSVASFGEHLTVQSAEPTSDWQQIRQDIASIKIDGTGVERTCSSVRGIIRYFDRFAKVTKRRLVLIVATDESGEPEDNWQNLELAIDDATRRHATVYVLGRESVFGYLHAFVRWKDVNTGVIHSLPIHRGPESAYPELLQTDGLGVRSDSYPSGSGTYDLCRLAVETGGTYFLLPDNETNLIQAEEGRRFSREPMEGYLPELISRQQYKVQLANSQLRSTIIQVVHGLNPNTQRGDNWLELARQFSGNITQLREEAGKEAPRVHKILRAFALAEARLDEVRAERANETSRRWQANYDLLYAQIVGYQLRLRQYASRLQEYANSPPKILSTTRTDLAFACYFHDQAIPELERVKELFQIVIDNHPRTPWASRARGELRQGFAVDFRVVRAPIDQETLRPTTRL